MRLRHICLLVLFVFVFAFPARSNVRHFIVETPTDGGIRENVSSKHRAKFDKWKAELFQTEIGRKQWETYAENKQFILTIIVTGNKGQGAGTDKFLWNDAGELVGATITLGSKIDSGYPEPAYYPVMNSLSLSKHSPSMNGNVLAATKLIHEIGHVNQTSKENREIVQTQDKFMPVYIDIFLKNGHNATDEKLLELEGKMGGTPMKIWESREYWSEVNAMLFLNERINKEDFYCSVLDKIKTNVETYAKNYEARFFEVAETNPLCSK